MQIVDHSTDYALNGQLGGSMAATSTGKGATHLTELFWAHVVAVPTESLARHEELEEVLSRLLRRGQEAWPQVQLGTEQFVRFLARHVELTQLSPASAEALNAEGLFLACAYGLGDRAAYTILEQQIMTKVRAALLRIGISESLVGDIQQELREQLLSQQQPDFNRKGYAGKGELDAWLRVCAVRRGVALLRKASHQESLADVSTAIVLEQSSSIEMRLLRTLYKLPLQQAINEAVSALSSRERNLLRARFVAHWSIDQIAAFYSVHRATTARWLVAAQAKLAEQTRLRFVAQTPMTEQSYEGVLAALQAHLSVNLEQLLKSATDSQVAV
jgi:RNA polymerase sigma-70 factor (ECF subfamily)